jgi:cellulose synthase/poly-beta-1,6-N-acetylglucosamine synthase-like glycosyltransferase
MPVVLKETSGPGTRADKNRPAWLIQGEVLRTATQIGLTFVLGLLVPLFSYIVMGRIGFDVSPIAYLAIVSLMVVNAFLLWIEAWLGYRRDGASELSSISYPPATAIIAAYLPNEAETIIETIEAFLRIDYPNRIKIILAYNTPYPLSIESKLIRISRQEPGFELLRVKDSTSKAQNINAAAMRATGEFIGIFDADHHPASDGFSRAWRYLSGGFDVVQGRCVIRNGDASWVARLVAVEFETLYALSHLGRSRLHNFGIFGGSNGYWKTSLLQDTPMQKAMLTEDIDATMRVLQLGGKIAFDRSLISHELAPETVAVLWNQRMRWAQGWFQVSMKHLRSALTSPHLSLRQKLGHFYLLGWCAIFPWLAFQIIPILLYWLGWRSEHLNWVVPVFICTTIFIFSTTPLQILLTYRVAMPELKSRRWWFVVYAISTVVFYAEFKNLIARAAQIKEAMQDRKWRVTPRS